MNDKEKQAIIDAKNLIEVYEQYCIPIHYGEDENTMTKTLLDIIKKLEKERDGIYNDYQDLGKEKLKLEEKIENLKKKCTDKEWIHCRVEKMGCEGCHYNKTKEG